MSESTILTPQEYSLKRARAKASEEFSEAKHCIKFQKWFFETQKDSRRELPFYFHSNTYGGTNIKQCQFSKELENKGWEIHEHRTYENESYVKVQPSRFSSLLNRIDFDFSDC